MAIRSLSVRAVLLMALAFLSGGALAAPEPYMLKPGGTYVVRGVESKGGSIEFFLNSVKLFRKSKVKVVLAEDCYSSCTLYSALIRDGLVCARRGVRLIFHKFVYGTDFVIRGGVATSYRVVGEIRGEAFTRIWQTYPVRVRAAIMAHSPNGGLPPHGRELSIPAATLGIPTC